MQGQCKISLGNTDRPGIVNESAEDVGHAKALGVARENPAVPRGARRPAEPRGALQHVLAAVRQDPQVTVDALQRHDAPVLVGAREDRERAQRLGELDPGRAPALGDRKSTRLNSSHLVISYAVFCLKKKKRTGKSTTSEDPPCANSRAA